MSLTDPKKKMSKSDANPNSRILLTDDRDSIHRKIKNALTDSYPGITYDPQTRPGVSNLLDILGYLKEDEPKSKPKSMHEIAASFENASLRSFKLEVAQTIINALEGMRERFLHFQTDTKLLEESARRGQRQAASAAEQTLRQVKQAVGIY